MSNVSNQVFLYNGNTLVNTYSTIQDAINAASAFDTIKIGTGTYNENVNVDVNGLTIENVAGDQVTIVGQGGYSGAIDVASNVYGVTIKSSDGIPGNFIVEGSTSIPQLAALYIVGNNDNITINGITTTAPVTGDGGLNSVVTGGSVTNVLFENNVFQGNADQLVYVNGAEDIGPQAQDGYISFVGNTFAGSAPGGLLGMSAPGEVINNKFTGTTSVDIGLNEAGVTVTGNTFNNTPTEGYFFGNGAYDPQTIEANNSFSGQGAIYIIQNGAPQDGVYSSIQAAIDAAIPGDTVFVGNGTYNENVALVDGVNVEGQSQAGVIINGTISTPVDFDNTTVSNLTVNDSSANAMLLDMTATQEVTSSQFSNITFNLETNSNEAQLIGNGQVANDIALNGSGLTFSGVTMNTNDFIAGSTAFAYTLFHSVGGAQLTLDDVSLKGDASGSVSGSNNLVAQWNMSPEGNEPADVTLENSSTSGGGNFYLSGLSSAMVTGNTFNGQGFALNGVTNATVTGNTFEGIGTTYSPGNIGSIDSPPDYEHQGLSIENAWGASGDSTISVTGNTFENISTPNGAIAFEYFTDGSGNEIPATTTTLNNIDIQGNTFTNVDTPIYVDTNAAGGLLPSTIGDSQVLIAPTGTATVTAPASGDTDIFGGGGIDTVNFGTGYSISISNGQWVVSNGAVTDTLSGIDKVDINGTTYDLVDQFGAVGGFQSIQAAINAASAGNTIMVAPGTYNESLNIDQGVTILGANAGISGTGSRGAETIITGQSQITTSDQVVINGVEFLDNQPYTLSSSDDFTALTIDENSTAGDIVEDSVFYRDPTSNPVGFSANTFVGSSSQPTASRHRYCQCERWHAGYDRRQPVHRNRSVLLCGR